MTIYSGKSIRPYAIGVKTSNPSNRGFISNPQFGPRSQAPLSGMMIDWIYALKTTTTRQGFRLTCMQKGAKIIRKLKGIYAGRLVIGARNSVKNGVYVSKAVKVGNCKLRVVSGLFLHPLWIDSNTSGQIDLLLTPTFTYDDSAITLEAHSAIPLSGKYSLAINSIVAIPFQAEPGDITHLLFDIDLARLSAGDNNCILSFQFEDGSSKFLKFIITSEVIDRQVSAQKIRLYSGGWNIAGDVSRSNILLGGARDTAFTVNYPKDGGVITTTDKTAVRTTHNSGILGINITEAGCKYLVSFDGRNTWHAWDGSGFVVVDPLQIDVYGMDAATLSGITRLQWDTIFQKNQLDFKIYFPAPIVAVNPNLSYEQNGSTNTWVSTVIDKVASIPVNFVITEIDITCNHRYSSGNFSVNYIDMATGATVSVIPTTPTIGALDTPPRQYPGLDAMPINNTLAYKVYFPNGGDGYQFAITTKGYFKPYVSSIQVLLPPNLAPDITDMAITPSSLHAESPILTAHIKDPDGDPAQYRVLVNGEVLQDYNAESTSSEYDISVIIPNDRLIVGTNAIAVQTYDGLSYGTPYTTYLTKVDARPSVSGVLDKLDLTAVIADEDSEDRVRYRIWVNGTVKVNWSEFAEPPVDVYYKIDQRDVIIGRQNTVTLEVQDDIGGVTSVDFDFVGQNCGVKKYAVIM